MTTIICFAGTSFAAKPKLVDNFDDGNDMSALGGWWFTYNDSEDGGNSTVWPPEDKFKPIKTKDKPGYAARMYGTAGNKLGWDYFGMGVTLDNNAGCPKSAPMDLRKYSALQFKIKGSIKGGRLTVIIPYIDNRCKDNEPVTLTGWTDYEASITASVSNKWTTVKLDLRKDFSQPNWVKKKHKVSIEQVLKQMHTIEWHYSSQDGESIDIWVDDIEFI